MKTNKVQKGGEAFEIHGICSAYAEWIFEYLEKSDGSKVDKAMFNKIVDSFYEARGWDKKTGWLTRAKLEELGLGDVANELASIGRLP